MSEQQVVREIAEATGWHGRGFVGKVTDNDLRVAAAVYRVVVAPIVADAEAAERRGAVKALRSAADAEMLLNGPTLVVERLLARTDAIENGAEAEALCRHGRTRCACLPNYGFTTESEAR
jgi:hypothetical protein